MTRGQPVENLSAPVASCRTAAVNLLFTHPSARPQPSLADANAPQCALADSRFAQGRAEARVSGLRSYIAQARLLPKPTALSTGAGEEISIPYSAETKPLLPRVHAIPPSMLGMLEAVLDGLGITEEEALNWRRKDGHTKACRAELVRALREECPVYGEAPTFDQLRHLLRAPNQSAVFDAYLRGKRAHARLNGVLNPPREPAVNTPRRTRDPEIQT